MGQLAHVAEYPDLRVLPDGAGIIKDQVSLFRFLGKAKAHFGQHTHEPLAVGGVLLTAVAADQGEKDMVLPKPFRQKPGAPGGIVPLLFSLLRREKDLGTFVGMCLLLGQNGTSETRLPPVFAHMPGQGISLLFYHACL